jgi:GAF domain-containing protein
MQQEPLTLRGFGEQVMRTREPLLINEGMQAARVAAGSTTVGGAGAVAPKSGIWVPLVVGEQARGVVSIQNVDREHAFSDSDFRLLISRKTSPEAARAARMRFRRSRGSRSAARRAAGRSVGWNAERACRHHAIRLCWIR